MEIIVNLHVFFNNYEKMAAWLKTKNYNLGNMRPIDLIEKGREKKVLQFIIDALDSE